MSKLAHSNTETMNQIEAANVMRAIRHDMPDMAAHLDATYPTDRDRVKAVRESVAASGRS